MRHAIDAGNPRGPNPSRGMRSRSGARAPYHSTERLYTWDVLTISFCGLMIGLALAFPHRITMWPAVVATSSLIVACVWGLATLHQRTGSPVARFLHEWAFPPLVYVIYLELYWVVGPIHRGWIADPWLMAIDRAVLGVHPTLWLSRVATPWLTEITQIAYASFYAFVIVVGVELYARKKYAEFHLYAFACAFGFLASYVGYLLVPAVGPRFTLHDFSVLERELPGMLLTSPLRTFVNAGGLVSSGMPSAAAIAMAHRDAFPSGHAMMTIIAVFWSWRFRLFLRWPLTVVGATLVFATVYLRYHFLVDVVAGVACAAVCIATTRKLHAWLWSRTGALDAPAGSSRTIRPSHLTPGRRFPVHAGPGSAEI
jgi:membrane-associated phospholipid phosphatase